MTAAIDPSILDSSYESPGRYQRISGPTGHITSDQGPSESFIPATRIGRSWSGAAASPVGAVRTKGYGNTVKVEIDEEAWASLHRTVFRSFPAPSIDKIAVKVISGHGDEAMKVFEVTP